jgi:mono/diheme cytochrome c family protein/cytochrome c553
MARDGRRELLAADPEISCSQPVPLAPRPRPHRRPEVADHRRGTATFFLRDIGDGPGLAGIPRGSVRRIRVVAIEYRAAGIRRNFSEGPAGAALSSTPVSIGNGAWDVKRVLGEAAVLEDGSALFSVPARTPVYFQALDGRGRALQTMRSWTSLQPGETAACIGCHEPKSRAPRAGPTALALRRPPEMLPPPGASPRGFSFAREVQPILDRHCIGCHEERGAARPERRDARGGGGGRRAFSLLAATIPEPESGRAWSDAYIALTGARPLPLGGNPLVIRADPDRGLVRWSGAQSSPPMLAPASTGAVRSPLLEMLDRGHRDVRLDPEELETIARWIDLAVPYCGDYAEASIWTAEERRTYERLLEKRRRSEEIERRGIEEVIAGRGPAARATGRSEP